METHNRDELLLGDELHGFILESVDLLDEYHGYGYRYRHRITGMDVYHISNKDTENFFGFIFKTPPLNDCGTPHIIEHSVLAGSKRYPVRDPFMSYLKGSANTFMNAMTYPDYTVYPAASPLPKDFYYLFCVYADAVFSPLLREETFWQEGVRISVGEEQKLSFDGVVFNEMLGELSDHDSIVGRQSIRSLYPDTPYFYESGGDPKEIISLNYRQFLGYYSTYYHPSNCRLFLYGDQPIGDKLALLDQQYLADYSAVSHAGATTLAKPWKNPKMVVTTSPADEETNGKKNASVAISWATTLAEDPIEVLTLSILTDILLGNPGAPLYKAIIDSHLSKDISQVSGMDTSFRQMPFTVGFKGIEAEDAKAGETLVLQTLTTLVQEGIPSSLIENAMKKQEFLLQEVASDGPMGLRIMSRAVRGWLQDLPPHRSISIASSLQELKSRIQERSTQKGELFPKKEFVRGYLEQWIVEHLIENPHRCLLVVKPDLSHATKLEEAINARIDEVKKQLGSEGMVRLQEENSRFLCFESTKDSQEALSTIPHITKNDLPESIKKLPQSLLEISTVPVYLQPAWTNGIVYVSGLISVELLTEEEQYLLPLFVRLLHMSGIGTIPYDQVAVNIRNKTGGLYFFLENSSSIQEMNISQASIMFRMKCLERDLPSALELLSDIIIHAKVDDTERIAAVLNDIVSDFESNVGSYGQMYASQRAASHFSHILHQSEVWNGISQWFYLIDRITQGESIVEKIGASLCAIQQKIAARQRLKLHLCAQEEILSDATRLLDPFIHSFADQREEDFSFITTQQPKRPLNPSLLELYSIPSSVSFSALVCLSAQPTDPLQAHQTVLTHILTTNHLWEQVRGVGGAYGVSAHIDMLERLCTFNSYRDPRIEGTLSDFVSILERIAQDGVEKELVDLAIISLVSKELRPLYPKDASMIAFRRALYGITDEFRAIRRSWVLHTTAEDVKQAASILLDSVRTSSVATVIAGQEVLHRESQKSKRMRETPIRLPL